MLATYHAHTLFCDGEDSPDAMADAAWAAGYRIFGFSAHAPIPLDSPGNLSPERVAPYARAVHLSSERYAGRMEVLTGLEIDWVPGLGIPSDAEYASVPIDYRIGSVHFVTPPTGEPFAVDYSQDEFDLRMEEGYGGDGARLYRDYYRNVAELVRTGGFEILGHMDLVKKNNPDNRWFDETDPAYLRAAFEAVEALEGSGIAAEVNTGGFARGKTTRPYPILPILKELRRRKVPVLIGADAHAASHLDLKWRRVGVELIREAGYTELAVFRKTGWSSGPVE